jgi:hypothetical protein
VIRFLTGSVLPGTSLSREHSVRCRYHPRTSSATAASRRYAPPPPTPAAESRRIEAPAPAGFTCSFAAGSSPIIGRERTRPLGARARKRPGARNRDGSRATPSLRDRTAHIVHRSDGRDGSRS